MAVFENYEDRYQDNLDQLLKIEAEENDSEPRSSYEVREWEKAYDNIKFENLQLKVQCENTAKKLRKNYEGKINYLKNNGENLKQRNLDLLSKRDDLSAENQKLQKEFNEYKEQATKEISEYKRQINELNKKLNFEKLNTAQKTYQRVHIRVPEDVYKEINKCIKQSKIKTISNVFNIAIYEGIEEDYLDDISNTQWNKYSEKYYNNKLKNINCNMESSLYKKLKQITRGREMSLTAFALLECYIEKHKLSK